MFLHYSRSTQILYRLSLTDDPAWDRAAVRQSVDLLATLEEAAARFAGVVRAASLSSDGPDGGDMYTKGAAALRATIPIWRSSLEHVGAIPPGSSSCSSSSSSSSTAASTAAAENDSNAAAAAAAAAATATATAVDGGGGGGGCGGGSSGNDEAASANVESGAYADMVEVVNGGEFQLNSLDLLQDFPDFADDPWITDFFTWGVRVGE